MSTCYSILKPPVTRVLVDEPGRVTLYVNRRFAGVLTMAQAEVADFLRLLFGDDDVLTVTSNTIVAPDDGVTEHWRDDVLLLSEYGELTTWGELRRANKEQNSGDCDRQRDA